MSNTCNISPKFRDLRQYASRCTVRHRQPHSQWMMLRRLQLIPFFQEYWPIPGARARLPADFFDMDLNEVIRLTFRSNGQNWEKYLRWLNRLYYETFGRYYGQK